MLRIAGEGDRRDVSALSAVWLAIMDALVTWWLDHPEETAAAMTERCVRLFRVVLTSPLPGVDTAD
jgi:riboflavin biosynthesis pyrimidine reductase